MTLLAIDTSTAFASLALYDGRTVLAEVTWHAHRRHDDHLFPGIERMLAVAGATLADVSRVAVAIGPGSFTGVRVAIASGQGIARASGAAMIGVVTLDVAAHPFAGSRTRVCALIPAGRGEHYAAMYRQRQGVWARTSDIEIRSAVDLARHVAADTLFVGEIDDATASALRDALGPRALFPPPSADVRRAGHLAELGWAGFERGDAETGRPVEPLYIRAPFIRGT